MKSVGNNILVKPEPRDRRLASGIIVPDTVDNKDFEWGIVVQGNEDAGGDVVDVVGTGSRVLFSGRNCYSDGKNKEVAVKKCLYWV